MGNKETVRYTCYHKSQRLNDCDGQSVYIAEKIDTMVAEIVKHYLARVKQTPKDKALELRYKNELQQKKLQWKKLEDEKFRLEKRLREASMEIGKSLTGESVFSTDVLSMSINAIKEDLTRIEKQIETCETELEAKDGVLRMLR